MKHLMIKGIVCMGLLAGGIAFANSNQVKNYVELQDIVSPTKVEYDSVWYARQAEGWAKEIKKNAKNEDAWLFPWEGSNAFLISSMSAGVSDELFRIHTFPNFVQK